MSSILDEVIEPFVGVDMGHEGDPASPVGEYTVELDNAVAGSFTHFEIQVKNESGTWKGYVGKGALFGTMAGAGSPAHMEAWNQAPVTHEAQDIKLDLTSLPYDNGIADLVAGGFGFTLSDSSTYYVYLKITRSFRYSSAKNELFNDIDDGNGGTVIVDVINTIETLFTTSLQTSGAPTSIFSGAHSRYFPIGVVKTSAEDSGATVAQLSLHAIYLEPVVLGVVIGGEAGAIVLDSNGILNNDGVHSLIVGTHGISLDPSTGVGDVTINDP